MDYPLTTRSTALATRPARRTAASPRIGARAQARALGWVSIGLGVAELLAPRATAQAIGRADRRDLMPWYGLREIANGVGLLMARDPTPWVWLRVGGDALDLATLASPGPRTTPEADARLAAALAATACITLVDLHCARALADEADRRSWSVRAFGDRSGFPATPRKMRGAALADFTPPPDMVTPEALRPWARRRPAGAGVRNA
ncbi:MAG: cyclase dehydrase [Pseudomonadota bacterium]